MKFTEPKYDFKISTETVFENDIIFYSQRDDCSDFDEPIGWSVFKYGKWSAPYFSLISSVAVKQPIKNMRCER